MVNELVVHPCRDFLLMAFNVGVLEFFDTSTADADDMVVVGTFIKFIDSFACFKIIP